MLRFMCMYIYVHISYSVWYCMILYVYVYILPRTMVTNKGCANQVLDGVPSPGSPLSWELFPLQPTSSLLVEETHQTTNLGGPYESTEVCLQHPLSRLFLLHHRVWCVSTVSNHAFCWWNHRLFWLNYHISYILLLVKYWWNSPIVTMLPLHIWVPHNFCTLRQGQCWKRAWLPGQELPVQPGPDKVFLGAHDVFSTYKNYGFYDPNGFEQTMISGNFKKGDPSQKNGALHTKKKQILLFYDTCDLRKRSGGLQCKVA